MLHYFRQGGFISIGLLAGLHKKLQGDLAEIFRKRLDLAQLN